MNTNNSRQQPYYKLILLIISGESVFLLPFVLARVFRPTFLDVFGLNNLQLGICFSVYGIVAMISYFLGGSLADRFKPNVLMGLSLVLTAMGGIYMAYYPSLLHLQILFGYWGFTTIFLFWAAMIKATRIWGGSAKQVRAFAFLDGGRGLVAASLGSIGVLIFGYFITSDISSIDIHSKREAFRSVILFTSVFVGIIGILAYILLRDGNNENDTTKSIGIKQLIRVLKIPSVWYLMIIILCAYMAYKVTDIISLYANEVMFFDEIKSANVGTFLLFLRPVVGIIIGIIASWIKSTKFLILSFLILTIGAFYFASGANNDGQVLVFFLSLIVISIGTYAARTLYFAVMQEGQIPLELTGTAVGIISFIGFTPDIFAGPLIGVLLDNNPGEPGHQKVFVVLTLFSIIGLLAAFRFWKVTSKPINLH